MGTVWAVLAIEMVAVLVVAIALTRWTYRHEARRGGHRRGAARTPGRDLRVRARPTDAAASRAPRDRVRV